MSSPPRESKPPSAQPAYRRNLRREWVALSLLLLGFVAWLCSTAGLRALDHLIQDAGMRLSARPAHPDIVVVAIDDRSIDAIGRWPWRRALHAQLVDQITAQGPRAIGLDILFGEEDADYPGDDLLLARALERSGHVVLPVARRDLGARSMPDAPMPLLRNAADQLGHVQMMLDTDGVARRLYLTEGPQMAPWPHFSTALLCAAGQALPACAGNAAPASGPWTQRDLRVLRFARGNPAFTTYSYVDVLTGRIPNNVLRDKYVIVGATATGLGDMFAAPMVAHAERIPGVEMIGHALNAELMHWEIRPTSEAWIIAINLIPVALGLLAIALLGPLSGLMSCAALLVSTLAIGALAPAWLGRQFTVGPALIGIATAYPLWSWRRLSAAAHFLELEMHALLRAGLSPVAERQERVQPRGDLLERRIHAVEDATDRLRRLHQFVYDSLQHLPSPTFVCSADGHINLANEAALRHLAQPKAWQGHPIASLLADLVHPDSGRPLLPQTAGDLGHIPPQQEGRDGQGRHLLMLSRPFVLGEATVWLITLVDLTDMHHAQQQRDQALHFISHDMRAPVASILTLLEMQREFPEQMAGPQLLARIERHAHSALAMTQGFVQLAHAEAQEFRSVSFDLAIALETAVDDAWAAAQAHKVKLELTRPDSASIQGDPGLIGRAIGNVIGNAIKFSPANGTVHCALTQSAPYWVISVRDQGPGIAPEKQDHLFQPFKRLHTGSHPGIAGIGLGLALVQTVLQRHGGKVQVNSSVGAGTEFQLLLPMAGQTEPCPTEHPCR